MKHFILLLIALVCLPARAEDPAIAQLFAHYGLTGTMVISSLNTGQTFIHNEARAKQRFSPASTFKIPNTLIALETKAIQGKDDVLKWNGQHYNFPDWNHDQTLESAFKVSCVWCYQQMARRVGAKNYPKYLSKIDYGKLTQPFEVTTFWLDGSLQISAIEQIEFLKKVYRRTLPFSQTSFDTLRQIMLMEETPNHKLWAKTGWAARTTPQVGWYVGYVEKAKEVFFFALNIEVQNENELPLRQKLAREALQQKGIIEP